MLYKRLILKPTRIPVYIIITDDLQEAAKKLVKIGRQNEKYWRDIIGGSSCVFPISGSLKSGHESFGIVCYLASTSISTIVHESVHVAWECSNICGLGFAYDNQETQAYMTEYIVDAIIKLIRDGNKPKRDSGRVDSTGTVGTVEPGPIDSTESGNPSWDMQQVSCTVDEILLSHENNQTSTDGRND